MKDIKNALKQALTALATIFAIVAMAQENNCTYGTQSQVCYSFAECGSGCPSCGEGWTCGPSGQPFPPPGALCTAYNTSCVAGSDYESCDTYSWNWACLKLRYVSPNCPTDCGNQTTVLDSASGSCYDTNVIGCD